MKYLFSITLVALLNSVTHGQKTPKLPLFITECIIKGANGEAYKKTKKDFAHFFAIAIHFNDDGRIETLHYSSKLNPDTKQIYALDDSLLQRIKTYNFKCKEYALKTVLFTYYCYNGTDDSVAYENGFLSNIENLIPEVVYDKSLIILKPIVDANLPSAHKSDQR